MNTPASPEWKVESISLENLILDPQNPRLPPSVQEGDESDYIEYLMKSADVLELMGSIGSRGYFEGEPILVTKEGAKDGSYIVVEGNCRLTASKLLNEPDLAIKRKKTVTEIAEQATCKVSTLPCVVYETRDEILDYLGYRHVKGAHPWDALQKARYLEQLKRRLEKDFQGWELHKQLAKEIGSTPGYVAKLLSSLNLYHHIRAHDFFDTDLSEDDISFSLLSTSLSYTSICQYLGLENSSDVEAPNLKLENLGKLTSWLFEENKEGVTRLGESRNLKSLAAVVEHEQALEKFMKGESLEEAANWTSLPRETFHISVQETKNGLRRALEVIHRVTETSEDDIMELKEIQALLRGLHAQVKDKLPTDKDEFGELL
ncbi:MAG: ParB N-terminal domain-containing protein [Gammaproteobacteria bacterium]|nr:ParB N-terminal domain-containing protein [Gammaproteobacteria bacterium]